MNSCVCHTFSETSFQAMPKDYLCHYHWSTFPLHENHLYDHDYDSNHHVAYYCDNYHNVDDNHCAVDYVDYGHVQNVHHDLRNVHNDPHVPQNLVNVCHSDNFIKSWHKFWSTGLQFRIVEIKTSSKRIGITYTAAAAAKLDRQHKGENTLLLDFYTINYSEFLT
ncbi:hypothetical protein FF38_00484 [Lucilia cuprina]|uniref:Uncharacterized protein n=1 Tax=Lucilia cuprina TaxID=7375 RepID=A0A0L0CJC0_LUCCU|nr:hypothetical protein FF38_00484 [Lucilia cuprina]